MDQARDGAHGSRPSTASIQVRELSSQGLHNPQPQSKAPGRSGHGHSEQLAEECLSPARLVSAGLGSAGCQMPSAPRAPAPPGGQPQVPGDTEVPRHSGQKGPSQALPRICCAWGSRDPEPDRRAFVLVETVTGPRSTQHADFTSCEQRRAAGIWGLLRRGGSVPY